MRLCLSEVACNGKLLKSMIDIVKQDCSGAISFGKTPIILRAQIGLYNEASPTLSIMILHSEAENRFFGHFFRNANTS